MKQIWLSQFQATDDLSRFRLAADYLRAHPGMTLVVPPGDYFWRIPEAVDLQLAVMRGECGRLPQNQLFTPDFPYAVGLDLTDCRDTTIIGYGARIYIDGFFELVLLYRTRNVRLAGFHFDCVRKPYSKGRIIACDEETMTVDFAGQSMISAAMPALRAVAADANNLWRYAIVSLPSELTLTAVDSSRIRFQNFAWPEAVGMEFYLWHSFHFRPVIHLWEAENTTLESIAIHAAHGMGVVGFHARDIVLRRCEVVPALGEAVSTNTDATHFAACRGSITVEGCHFCGHGDDAINVHAYYHTITAAEGDSCSLELRAPTGTHTQKADRFFPGDRIELIDPATLAVQERFTVKRFIALPNNHSKVGLDRPLPPMSTGKLLVNIDQLPALFFRHNLVTDHMGRSVLAKTRHVRIEANTFARSTGTAIQIAGEAEWAEGATAEDVLIRHNRILYCGRIAPRLWGVWRETGGIAVNLSAADSHAVAHRRIRIEENWIDCPQITHAVYAGNTDGMTVRRNMLHSKEAPLVCADCRKLCVEDNLEKTPP